MAERHYLGTFCTGHTPMVGTTAFQFSENTYHEFIEEYKNAHGLKEKSGPGRAKVHDPLAIRRQSPAQLPVTGCALARLGTGNKPERQRPTSAKAIGSWWDDPIFRPDANLKDAVLKPGEKGPPPPCMATRSHRTTSAEVGQYWFDDIVSEKDPEAALKRAKNGIRRLLPVESATTFALEDLPTQHRIL